VVLNVGEGREMNKAELIEAVGKSVCSKKEAAAAVDAVLKAIKATLKKSGNVTLIGFGTFKTAKRKARTGRNPRTGASIKIPGKNVPVFRAGSALKEAVESGPGSGKNPPPPKKIIGKIH